jgi:HlyD family secretion protein
MYKNVLIASGIGLAALTGYLFAGQMSERPPLPASSRPAASPIGWVAAAPGRVEPKSGEIRIGPSLLGRVVEVTVKVNDKVEEGELLVRLDDDEARARLAGAEAEAGARKRERSEQPATPGREEATKAEDAVFEAERAVTGARYELDFALVAKRTGKGDAQALADARKRLIEARERFQKERMAFAVAQAKPKLPTPNRFESALTAARANVTMADALLDRTQIRAPEAGTALQVNAKVGEIAGPGGDQPLVVVGDMSIVRVKAEVDDGDVAKLKVGQKAFVKSINYPGKEFEGRVSALAPTLAAPRIAGRGPRRLTDVEVLEMTIDLDGKVPLLPGMRVDAFVRKD